MCHSCSVEYPNHVKRILYIVSSFSVLRKTYSAAENSFVGLDRPSTYDVFYSSDVHSLFVELVLLY